MGSWAMVSSAAVVQTLEAAAGFACAHLLALSAFVTSVARRVPHRPPGRVPRRPPGRAISSLCHVLRSQSLSRRFPGPGGRLPWPLTPRLRRSELKLAVVCSCWVMSVAVGQRCCRGRRMLRRGRVDTKGSNVETATQPLRGEQCMVILRRNNGKSPHTRREENINSPDQNIALLWQKGHEVRNTSSPGQTPKLQLFAGEALAKQRGTHQRHKYYDDSIMSKCQG